MDFQESLKNIFPVLKRITLRLKGRCGFLNEQDLYQEAMIHLWKDFKQGKLQDKTDSYILQGCYFHLKNYIRTHSDKARLTSLEAAPDSRQEGCLEDIPSLLRQERQDPRDYFHNKLLAQTILNNGLNRREKEVLYYCSQGLTTREMGSRLGVSHVRIVKIMRNIREKCRAYNDSV